MTALRNGQALPTDDTVQLVDPSSGVEYPVFVTEDETLTIEELSPDNDDDAAVIDANKRYKNRVHRYQKNHPGETVEQARARLATPRVVDFRLDDTYPVSEAKRYSDQGLVMTPKQIRRRAQRKLKNNPRMSLDEAYEGTLKPLAEWDMEELARGRPRNERGTFEGAAPAFVSRQITEEALERFKVVIREEMNAQTMTGLKTLALVLEDERVDARGRPFVSANVKVDVAKFFIEHVVGKAVQPTQSEISVKLQGILGAVLVSPTEFQSLPTDYTMAQRGSRGDGDNPYGLPRELEGVFEDAVIVDEEDEDGDSSGE